MITAWVISSPPPFRVDHKAIGVVFDALDRFHVAGKLEIFQFTAELIDHFQAADHLVILNPGEGQVIIGLPTHVFRNHQNVQAFSDGVNRRS
jgi:hypothetical protein